MDSWFNRSIDENNHFEDALYGIGTALQSPVGEFNFLIPQNNSKIITSKKNIKEFHPNIHLSKVNTNVNNKEELKAFQLVSNLTTKRKFPV